MAFFVIAYFCSINISYSEDESSVKKLNIPGIPSSPSSKQELAEHGKYPAVKLWYVSQTPVVPHSTALPQPVHADQETVKPAPKTVAMPQPPEEAASLSTPKADEFKPTGEKLDLRKRDIEGQKTVLRTPELKKIDISRIGASTYYETYQGLRLLKYFTVAERVEIYQEPKPIDSYILDAKKMRWVNLNQPWDKASQLRSEVIPIFTRAYGTEITVSDPNDKEGQIRYTHDYRDIYGNQFPLYQQDNARNVNYKIERWDQNEILVMHSKKIPGIDWDYTSNFGYRYSTMNGKNDGSTFAYYENRHTYFTYASIAPTDKLEFFGQFEYFKSKRPDASFIFNPDHYFYATEIRMKSGDYKTSFVPRFSYSIDRYQPLYNRFSKYEWQFRVGHDFNPKFGATSTLKYVWSQRNDVDNTAPLYTRPNPINEGAGWAGIENRAQYNVYDRLWLQGGLDIAAGTNMSDFDNIGYLAGLEYYAPGMIRVDFGWKGNQYYNIKDFLSTVYFKFYLFM